MAEAYNMRVAPHNAAGPICTAAELQLDACISNFLIQEVYPFRAPETYEIVDRPPEREIRDGRLPIPDRPGLGVELAPLPVGPLSMIRGPTPARSPRRSTTRRGSLLPGSIPRWDNRLSHRGNMGGLRSMDRSRVFSAPASR
jgi:hypothetical protein